MTLPVSNKQSRLGHVVVHRGIAQSRGPGTGLCISAAPDQAWVSPVPQNKQMSAERVYGVGGGDPCCFRLSASRRGRKPQPGGRASRVLLTEGALCRPAGFVAGCGFWCGLPEPHSAESPKLEEITCPLLGAAHPADC